MWLEQKSIQLKWSTTESLEALIRLHIRPALGHLRLNQVSPLLVEAFYSSLQGKKELSPATIKKVHTIMHQAFQQAVRYGQLPTNPMLSTKTPQANKPRIEVLSREQVKRVLAVAANQGPESYLRWLLALHYGLRQGETLALTWGDFEPSTGQLSINKSVNAKAGEGSIISRPKTDKANRIIPLTLQAQKSWKALAEYNTDVQDSTLVFQNTTGGYLNARTDYDRWHHLLKQAEVPKLKLHAARHTAATLLIESGADLRSVQLILGHSSPTFTASTYVHPSLMHIRSALEGVQISSNSRPMPLSLTTENETANIDS
jgi:integrase